MRGSHGTLPALLNSRESAKPTCNVKQLITALSFFQGGSIHFLILDPVQFHKSLKVTLLSANTFVMAMKFVWAFVYTVYKMIQTEDMISI